tara:strand:- start:2270 stop:2557 length:288 start_codon:yes stop_codon:yes gene_type:complete
MPSRAGRPNKNKAFLLNRLQDMYGEDFHPIMKMAENAILLQAEAEKELDAATLKTAVDAWDKVAQYTEPKLKAIEGTMEVNASVVMKDLKGVPRD